MTGDAIALGRITSVSSGVSGSIGGRDIGKASELRYNIQVRIGPRLQTIEDVGCLEPEGDVDVFAFGVDQAVQVHMAGATGAGRMRLVISAPAHERASEACP
jgi:hypothetical protein